MFIDTHCHLSKNDYNDIKKILDENRKNRVSPIIISGCDKNSILESLDYANKISDVYVTIGYHPSEASVYHDEDIELLKKQLMNKKVIGVGEIGLDYHYGKEDRLQQISLFEKQLLIAEKLHLPVVIHSRDATYDTIQTLKKYSVTGVIHCFSGSIETAREYIKMGFVLGIGGVITFKNSNLRSVVAQLPLDKIVLETDSPYLTPAPYRGQQNSSKYIPLVAKKVSECQNVTLDEVERITTQTAKTVFRLD